MATAWNWLRRKGSVWLLRGVFLSTGTYLILSAVGFGWAPLNIEVLVGLNVAILWLFMELLLRLLDRPDDLEIVTWARLTEIGREALESAHEIEIVCSSSSSFYLPFYEVLSRRQDVRVRILMRRLPDASDDRKAKLREYSGYWESIRDAGARREIEVRFTDQDLLRMIRIDRLVAVGCYEWSDQHKRLLGHTVDMLLIRPSAAQNAYFVAFFDRLFRRLWSGGSTAL